MELLEVKQDNQKESRTEEKKEWKTPTLANYHGIISRFLDLKKINHYDLDSDKPKVVQEFETFERLVESMAKEEREYS